MEVIEVKKGSEGSSIDDEGYDANPQNGKDVEKYLEAGNDDMTAPVDVRISRSSEWGNLSFIHAFEQFPTNGNHCFFRFVFSEMSILGKWISKVFSSFVLVVRSR